MKHLLLLTTGGTIASVESEHGLIPGLEGNSLLEDIPQINDLCHLTVRSILNLDSTNLQPEDWQIIAKEVYAALPDFDGIIITHGTDTMAYTASALSYMIENIPKPVILTGSQLPMKTPGTDAKQNLVDAIRTALTGRAGVFIVFGSRILDGKSASKIHSVDFNAFTMVDGRNALGQIQNDRVSFSEEASPLPSKACTLSLSLCTDITLYQLFPGCSPDLLMKAIDSGTKGIILLGYGSGNVPNQGRSFLPLLAYAAEKKIPVVLGTQCLYGGCSSTYEVGELALNTGALSAGNLSTESCILRLMHLLGQTSDLEEIRRLWNASDAD
jgi:L-asparaginase